MGVKLGVGWSSVFGCDVVGIDKDFYLEDVFAVVDVRDGNDDRVALVFPLRSRCFLFDATGERVKYNIAKDELTHYEELSNYMKKGVKHIEKQYFESIGYDSYDKVEKDRKSLIEENKVKMEALQAENERLEKEAEERDELEAKLDKENGAA